MMPSTACGLILAGAALALWRAEAGLWRRRAVRGAGGLIALLGLLALTLNRLSDELRGPGGLFAPGWLASSTALCFALAGAAFWLLDARRWWTRMGQWLAPKQPFRIRCVNTANFSATSASFGPTAVFTGLRLAPVISITPGASVNACSA
jgi:hypothetical protein